MTRRKKKNANKVQHLADGTTAIHIKQRSGRVHVCLIDTEDYGLVRDHNLSVDVRDRQIYVVATENPTPGKRAGRVYLHRLLLPGHKQVDHENTDSLDNRRKNLRPATPLQNVGNTRKHKKPTSSKYKGVYWSKRDKCFRSQAKGIPRGSFKTEEAAALAYDFAARKIFGEYARLNILSNPPQCEPETRFQSN
jgi:hypothetical protein